MAHIDQKYKQHYKNKFFNSEKDFEAWLESLAVKKIEFENHQQDLLTIYIHKGGEIIHCNLQSRIWNGMIVDLENLAVGRQLRLWNTDEQKFQSYTFVIKEIVDL